MGHKRCQLQIKGNLPTSQSVELNIRLPAERTVYIDRSTLLLNVGLSFLNSSSFDLVDFEFLSQNEIISER
jgi:hypothetical protein